MRIGELGPEGRGFVALMMTQGDQAFAAHQRAVVIGEFADERQYVKLVLTRQTQGHAANVVVLVLGRQCHGVRLIVLDLRQQPQGAGAHTGVLMLGQFQERGLGVVLALVQPHPGDVLDGIVRVLDRRNQAVDGFEIQLGQLVPLMTLGRDAEQPAAVEVAHAVTAHARIVPVGHNQGSIRRHLHIRRSEPAILLGAIQNVHDLRRIPRTAALDRVSPHNAGTGIAMDHLAVKYLGQERTFVDADAGRRTSAGEEEIGDHAGIV